MTTPNGTSKKQLPQVATHNVGRRAFLTGAGAVVGAAALASAAPSVIERYLKRNFRELSPERVAELLSSLEESYGKKYGKKVSVNATPAIAGVQFGYGLDLSRCIGCRRCVYACQKENNQSRDPQVQWIRVLEMKKDKGIDLVHSDPYYNPPQVPRKMRSTSRSSVNNVVVHPVCGLVP